MAAHGSAEQIVRRVWTDLGRDPAELAALPELPEVPLPARLDVSGLAAGTVAAASLAAAATAGPVSGGRARRVRIDGDRIATAFSSERWFQLDGSAPDVWAPLSGFRRAADGWVRTHANYPWHAAALRRGLGVPDDAGAEVVDHAIAERAAAEVERDVTAEGGVCVAVRPEDPEVDGRLTRRPLIELVATGDDGAGGRRTARGARRASVGTVGAEARRPLAGLRVLDLTRVIAGPVGTRTLALLGAEVLRVDPTELAEPEWQHLDSGMGKRSTRLDLRAARDRARFDELLGAADAIVLGYRPTALEALGLDPIELAARHPGLLIGQLAAWGFEGAAADRRGFDSIVQAESGIAMLEGDGERPGALPAQALDHGTGYLLAAALISMAGRRGEAGAGSGEARVARLSLRRTAAELLSLPRALEPTPVRRIDAMIAEPYLETLESDGRAVRVPAPAIGYDGALENWPSGPRPWGGDQATWAE